MLLAKKLYCIGRGDADPPTLSEKIFFLTAPNDLWIPTILGCVSNLSLDQN